MHSGSHLQETATYLRNPDTILSLNESLMTNVTEVLISMEIKLSFSYSILKV